MPMRENGIFCANLIWCRCNLAKKNFSNLARTKFGANRSFTSHILVYFLANLAIIEEKLNLAQPKKMFTLI